MSLSPGTQWGKITLWDAAADGNLELCKQRLSSSWFGLLEVELLLTETGQKLTHKMHKAKQHFMKVLKKTNFSTYFASACRWGHLEVVKFLISKKADPKLVTYSVERTTILHLAALNGHDSVISYLVKEGTLFTFKILAFGVQLDINAQDKFGDTPLIAASGAGKVSTTKLLLELGADRTILNHNKRTAEESASTNDISELFKEKDYVSATKY